MQNLLVSSFLIISGQKYDFFCKTKQKVKDL